MPKPPAAVYHYTDTAGLLGVIGRERLWATDVRFLNDGEEVSYAADRIIDQLEQRAEAIQAESLVEADERAAALIGLVSGLRSHATGRSGQILVACFCAEADLLSQWRGYGRKEGYALGFDFEVLSSVAAERGGQLVPIDYGGEDKIQKIVDDCAAMGSSGKPGAVGYVHAQNLQSTLATVKNPAFKEEDEWRLVLTGPEGWPDDLQFRIGSGLGVVPYVELGVKEALRTVAIGPGPQPELRQCGTEKLLAANGWDGVEVSIRPIAHTYRAMA